MTPKNEFENKYLNKVDEITEQARIFKKLTEKRLWELEDKKQLVNLTRSEYFELDMCKGDLQRVKDFLNGKK